MLTINYRFDTNRPSRSGMQFSFAETDTDETRTRRGPTENGVTPSDVVTVSTAAEAHAALKNWIGSTWQAWALVLVHGKNGDPSYYRLISGILTKELKSSIGRHVVICSHKPDGDYVSNSPLK